METLSRSIKQDTEQIYTHMTLDTLAATEAEKAVITDQLKKLKTMLLDEWDTDEDIEEWVAGGLLSELGGACVATQMGLSDLYQITQRGQPTQVSLSSVGLPMYLRGFYSIDASEGREPFSLLMKWMQAGIPSEQLCSLISTAVGFNTLGSLDMNEPIDWCVKPCVETEHRRWFQFHINFKGSEHPVRFLLKCLHVQVCLNAMGLLVHELINKDLLMCGTRAWSYLGADSVFSNAIFEKLTLLIEKDGGGNGTSLEAEKWVFVCRLFVFLRLNQGAGFDYQLPIGKQSFLLGGDIDIYRQLEACLTHQLQLFLDPSHMCPVPSDVERRFLRALDELYPVPPAP
jgi:hypothetical protein